MGIDCAEEFLYLMRKLHLLGATSQEIGGNKMFIPVRFSQMVDAHMLGNMLDIEHYPLILAIVGRPGTGKTFQLRNYLKIIGVQTFSVSAA